MMAVSALLQSSRPEDELFAVTLTAVHAEGRTALYDSVAEGLRHLDLGCGSRKLDVTVTAAGQGRLYVRTRAGYETRP
jgi:hypothetical protein